MASTTPNIGLTLPTGAEKVSRQIINDNNTIIDGKMGAVPGGQNLQGEIDALNSNMIQKSNLETKYFDAATTLTQNAWTPVISNLVTNGTPKIVNCVVDAGGYKYSNLPIYILNGTVGIYNPFSSNLTATTNSFVVLLKE